MVQVTDMTGGDAVILDPQILLDTLGVAVATGGEFAEVFVEDRRSISALLDDRRIEELTSGRDRGAGIRVVVGETTGFAHTADLSPAGLRAAATAAAAAARSGGSVPYTTLTPPTSHTLSIHVVSR